MKADGKRKVAKRNTALGTGIVLALWACAPSWAQDLTALPLEDLLRVEVTTASKYRQEAREVPSQVQVILADDIRRHAWRTLGEALSSLPGFYLSDDRAYQYLGARGFLIPGDYSTRFLLLLDGQRLNDNVYEQAPFGFNFPLDLSLVERIEVIPGPGSAIYGSNAVFGVINVITRRHDGRDRNGIATTLTSDGWRELRVGMQRRIGEDGPAVTASFSTGRQSARDLNIPGAGVAQGLGDAELGRAWFSVAQGGLSLSAWVMQQDVRPPTALYGTLFNDRRLQLADRGAGVALAIERDLGTDLQFSGRLSLREQRFRGLLPYDDGLGGSYLSRDEAHGDWWSAESRVLYTGWRQHKLIIGVDAQQDLKALLRNTDLSQGTVPGFDVDNKTWRAGLYVQDEWTLARGWRLSSGLRYDHSSIGFDRLSPRLGLLWAATERTTIKLLAGTAFRVPSAYERLYAAGGVIANPALQPEHIRTGELVVEHALGPDQLVGASIYQYRVQRLIEQVGLNGDTEFQFRNAGSDVRSTGVELFWKAPRLGAGSASASLALNRSRAADGGQLTNSPGWIAKLRASHPLPGQRWTAAAEVDAIGPRGIASAAGWQAVPTQWWVNASLSSKALWPGVSATLRLVNLLDRELQMPAGEAVTPVLPFYRRSLQLTLSHEF